MTRRRNPTVDRSAQVLDNAKVLDNAEVRDEAKVLDNAEVRDEAIKPLCLGAPRWQASPR